MQVTVGRTVIYHHMDGFDAAAIVVEVDENRGVLLAVFRPFNLEWKRADEGAGSGCWSWPTLSTELTP